MPGHVAVRRPSPRRLPLPEPTRQRASPLPTPTAFAGCVHTTWPAPLRGSSTNPQRFSRWAREIRNSGVLLDRGAARIAAEVPTGRRPQQIGKSHPGPKLYAEAEGQHGCKNNRHGAVRTEGEPSHHTAGSALRRSTREGGRETGPGNWKPNSQTRNRTTTSRSVTLNTDSRHITHNRTDPAHITDDNRPDRNRNQPTVQAHANPDRREKNNHR